MQNAKPLLLLARTTFSATLKIYVWFGWVKNNFEVFKFMVVTNFDKQMTSLRLFLWFSISRAPLRVHVSQADGLLLRWMYTHWGPHYGSGKRAIATATSSSILTRWSMATIRGGVMRNNYFPSLPFALSERSWVQTPRPAKMLQQLMSEALLWCYCVQRYKHKCVSKIRKFA